MQVHGKLLACGVHALSMADPAFNSGEELGNGPQSHCRPFPSISHPSTPLHASHRSLILLPTLHGAMETSLSELCASPVCRRAFFFPLLG